VSYINRSFLARPHSVYGQPSNEQHETVSAQRRQNRIGEEEGRSVDGRHQAERLSGQIHRVYT